MALNFCTVSIHPKPILIPKPKHLYFNLHFSSTKSSSFGAAALSEGTEGGTTDQEDLSTYSGSFSSSRTQLDLLEQLTSSASSVDGYESDGSNRKLTIRNQLAQLVGDRDDDFSIPE